MTKYAPGMRYYSLDDELDAEEFHNALKNGPGDECGLKEKHPWGKKCVLCGYQRSFDKRKKPYVTPTVTPVEPREVALAPLIPMDMRDGARLAFWHYHGLKYHRFWHDHPRFGCACGQPDDGEEGIDVPFWGMSEMTVMVQENEMEK